MAIEADLVEESVFGDYKIIKKIGKNAWSSNFLAEHRFIKKKYLLHIIHSYLLDDTRFMSLFEDFITKVVVLDHPSLLKIKNVSENHGHYFIVTEFLEDEIKTLSLTQYLFGRQDLLAEEEIFNILSQVASVLDYVHEKNFSCFSLFPDSISVNNSQAKPQIIITYLGVQRLFIKPSLLSYLQNDENMEMFFRYISFLSPEQKENITCNERSDVYSFGVLAYFLLFKKLPEGLFAMPSDTFPEYIYDWDFLLHSCLSRDPNLRNRPVSSLLRKKKEKARHLQKIHSLLQESEVKDTTLRALSLDVCEQPLVAVPPPLLEKDKNTRIYQEDIDSRESIVAEEATASHSAQNFVLVTPCSIDESIIDASINKSHLNDSEDTGKENVLSNESLSDEYSQVLHAMLNKDPVVSLYHLKKNVALEPKPLLTEMVLVQGGSFLRGSISGNRDESPRHTVNLNSFFIDIHPITNEQYLRFLDFICGEQDQNCNDLIRLKESRIHRRAGTLFIEPGYNKHPVVGVTWYGAVNYASWVGKRLPTESEWEIAARGGKEDYEFPTGNEISKAQANFFSSDTTQVMTYPGNGYGLYDMAGNVYEWCHDWYSYNYYEISSQEPIDPKGPSQGVYRVLRGGCWKSLKLDLRCSHRHRNNPGTVNSTYGFRCALDVR